MKVVILAGGLGTRISEESHAIPKPMIMIGDKPILWHIMKIYSAYGLNDFIICCGYKGYVIKEYFANYFLHSSDVTFDLGKNKVEIHKKKSEPWKVTLVDTGEHTSTGGRIRRVRDYVNGETFCMTYGDGLGNIDIEKLIKFHKKGRFIATVSSVQPPGRFGSLVVKNDLATMFQEKAPSNGTWINGGFFVLEDKAIDYIQGDGTNWEKEAMPVLARESKLGAFKHADFWACMDTMRDKEHLEQLWNMQKAPWKIW